MKKLAIALMTCILVSGCMNLYTRCPGTELKIEKTYQSTENSFAWSYVIMFPQVIMPSGRNKILFPENLISIPIGCLCFVDVACEAVVDTILYPVDNAIAAKRSHKESVPLEDQ